MVKLQIQQLVGDQIFLDNITAESFEDFIIVRIDEEQHIEDMYEKLNRIFENKKILIVPTSVTLDFYGLKEVSTNGS